jgi:hypothetical protein
MNSTIVVGGAHAGSSVHLKASLIKTLLFIGGRLFARSLEYPIKRELPVYLLKRGRGVYRS